MQKQAPSIGRILVAVGFTLSCFGLILFLWIAFGGPIPLKPRELPDHRLLPRGDPARRSSPTCGSAASRSARSRRSSSRRPTSASTARTRPRPRSRSSPSSRRSPSDARAILRQKTLLGETYVELTSGTEPGDAGGAGLARRGGQRLRRRGRGRRVDPGGRHARRQPDRGGDPDRRDLQRARRGDADRRSSAGRRTPRSAIDGRGLDLNDAFGNLGPFLTDASDILDVLAARRWR